jgi:hypothetical protein
MTRAWRARLSLTPDELCAVHSLVDVACLESEEKAFWDKLLNKVENAMERVPGGRYRSSRPLLEIDS